MLELIEGKEYELTFPKGSKQNVKLVSIDTYPSTGMPTDYIFEPIDDEEPKFNHPVMYPRYPIPQYLIPKTEIKEL